MEQRCVYILYGNKYYVWSTNDLERRLKEHKNNGYSAKRIGDWKLIKTIACNNRIEARRLELQIKKWGHMERRIDQS
jgi:predicted GIY-YIG superfamily endonuclease